MNLNTNVFIYKQLTVLACDARGTFAMTTISILIHNAVTRRSVNAVTPPSPKQADCSVTFIILCVAVTWHDFYATPSRLIEGTAIRPSYDSPTNFVTGPRLAKTVTGL